MLESRLSRLEAAEQKARRLRENWLALLSDFELDLLAHLAEGMQSQTTDAEWAAFVASVPGAETLLAKIEGKTVLLPDNTRIVLNAVGDDSRHSTGQSRIL